MKKTLDYIQALEKAVKEKYGDIATMNPKHFWDENKEKEYLQQIKEVSSKEYKNLDSKQKIEIDGVYIPQHVSNNTKKTCENCKKYSFNISDELYLNKFNICYKCYVLKEDK